MPTDAEITDQQELLEVHRRTLAICLKQKAKHGDANCPPDLWHSIHEARASIQRIKTILRGWNVNVEDHPDDVETTPPLANESNPLQKRPGLILGILVAAIGLVGILVGIIAVVFLFLARSSPVPLTVRVYDSTGAPVPRANVLLFSRDSSSPPFSQNTDSAGFASFEVTPGGATLVVETDEYQIVDRDLLLPRDKDVEVKLEERSGHLANVIVRVFGEDNSVVSGATVVISVEGAGEPFSDDSDSNGIASFNLPFPASGNIVARMTVRAANEGFIVNDQSVTLFPGAVQDVRLDRQQNKIAAVQPVTPRPAPTSASTSASSAQAAESGLLFSDNFDDGDALGWAPFTGDGDRAFVSDDGKYVLDVLDDSSTATFVGNSSWHNYSLRVRVQMASVFRNSYSKEILYNSFGVFVRADDRTCNIYILSYAQDYGPTLIDYVPVRDMEVAIWRSRGDGNPDCWTREDGHIWEKEIESEPYDIAEKNWYDIRVDCQDDTMTVYINEELVLTAIDSTYAQGRIGLFVEDQSQVYFDDLQVVPIP